MEIPIQYRFIGDEYVCNKFRNAALSYYKAMENITIKGPRKLKQFKQVFELDKAFGIYCIVQKAFHIGQITIVVPDQVVKFDYSEPIPDRDFLYLWFPSSDSGSHKYYVTLIDLKTGSTINPKSYDKETTITFPCELTTDITTWINTYFKLCDTPYVDCYDMGHMVRRCSLNLIQTDTSSWTEAQWIGLVEGTNPVTHSQQHNEYDIGYEIYYYEPVGRPAIIPDSTLFDYITSADYPYTWTEGTNSATYFYDTPADTADSAYNFMSMSLTHLWEISLLPIHFGRFTTYFYKEHTAVDNTVVTDLAVCFTTQETFWGAQDNPYFTGSPGYNTITRYYVPWYTNDNNPWMTRYDNILNKTGGYHYYDYGHILQHVPNSNKGNFEVLKLCRLGIGATCVFGLFLVKYYEWVGPTVFDMDYSPRYIVFPFLAYNEDIDPIQVLKYKPLIRGPIDLSKIPFTHIFKKKAGDGKIDILANSIKQLTDYMSTFTFDIQQRTISAYAPSTYGTQMLTRK